LGYGKIKKACQRCSDRLFDGFVFGVFLNLILIETTLMLKKWVEP